MPRKYLAGFLTLIGLGVLASCSDQQAPTVPRPALDEAPATFEAPGTSVYQEGDANTAVADNVGVAQVEFACDPRPGRRHEVLLIQDVVPWAAAPNQHPLGANVTELIAQGKDFCMITSEQIGTTRLEKFREILISAAQTQRFYDNLFPPPGLGTIHPAIVEYVERGGILSANLADFASGPGAGGTWAGDVFIAGVQRVAVFSNVNDIAAPSHPVIADELHCGPDGHCGRVVDGVGLRDDLDGWGSDSHGFFINLPPDTEVIIKDQVTGTPVMVEYPFGKGTVIANMTTTEYRYVGGFGGLPQERKLLSNEIAYQDCLIHGQGEGRGGGRDKLDKRCRRQN